ncbi:trehalose-phosphatase [Kineococcus radiotolerans]|uniref:Trehalose 6-phosphate phosphatase n=1 Tax=Kineococcus radiotolerans (strain ATCC BAA-149 / DSM 14245 / SRS30216) TaxID=266940 RepID=A6W6G8_KINRD|nr:trehalose-phosphatase [Kineococcus radiotolerans]ABS02407.1 HAD-superfamily hydrolase, subfamily IIB [Kineococcus radiotolerans SRS30216 = ATCC BAA-149]
MSLDAGVAAALRGFAARGRVLVALDFDGVLSPLVDEPSAARPLPEAVAALERLVATTDVALVSGRDLDDLRACAAPPAGVVLVGGHGTQSSLEGAAGGQTLSAAEAALLERLGAALDGIAAGRAGVHVERKPMSAVLHTRRASRPDAEAATAQALAGPATWEGVHPLRGKEVVELGVVQLGKGAGLLRLRERLSAQGPPVAAVLFAGDDVTDENAFAALSPADGDVTVKVGEGPTAASLRVGSPVEVAQLLHALADLRG